MCLPVSKILDVANIKHLTLKDPPGTCTLTEKSNENGGQDAASDARAERLTGWVEADSPSVAV